MSGVPNPEMSRATFHEELHALRFEIFKSYDVILQKINLEKHCITIKIVVVTSKFSKMGQVLQFLSGTQPS
jgi:hypothetical protein